MLHTVLSWSAFIHYLCLYQTVFMSEMLRSEAESSLKYITTWHNIEYKTKYAGGKVTFIFLGDFLKGV